MPSALSLVHSSPGGLLAPIAPSHPTSSSSSTFQTQRLSQLNLTATLDEDPEVELYLA